MFAPGLLAGRRALITGGGTGLGRAIGRRYLQLGARIAICGRRLSVLEATAAALRAEIPVIAAVNGPAMGAGCDLTCMCDLRIAGQSARFAESFVKLGIIPGDGGAWLLPRVVGFAKAAEMSLTGDALSADQALAYGLVSQVVPDAELLDAARALARRIAANPPQAVRMARRLLREAWNNRLDSVLEMSSAMQAVAHTTEDHKEALAAMREKRKPSYKGA